MLSIANLERSPLAHGGESLLLLIVILLRLRVVFEEK
jgi:hypothetical protein